MYFCQVPRLADNSQYIFRVCAENSVGVMSLEWQQKTGVVSVLILQSGPYSLRVGVTFICFVKQYIVISLIVQMFVRVAF